MEKFNLQTNSNSNLDNLPLGPFGPLVEKAGNALADVLSDFIDDIFEVKNNDLPDIEFDDMDTDYIYEDVNDEY